MVSKQSPTGTKEWTLHCENISLGCKLDCRYCYARYDAVKRFKRLESVEDWKTMVIYKRKMAKYCSEYKYCGKDRPRKYPKRQGTIMFPS